MALLKQARRDFAPATSTFSRGCGDPWNAIACGPWRRLVVRWSGEVYAAILSQSGGRLMTTRRPHRVRWLLAALGVSVAMSATADELVPAAEALPAILNHLKTVEARQEALDARWDKYGLFERALREDEAISAAGADPSRVITYAREWAGWLGSDYRSVRDALYNAPWYALDESQSVVDSEGAARRSELDQLAADVKAWSEFEAGFPEAVEKAIAALHQRLIATFRERVEYLRQCPDRDDACWEARRARLAQLRAEYDRQSEEYFQTVDRVKSFAKRFVEPMDIKLSGLSGGFGSDMPGVAN
jgi:hypothetical protein